MLCDFFFFKQKTADDMRMSDWSSDVCSSDLPALPLSYRPPPVEGSPIADRPLALQALMPKCAAERLPENHPVMQASRRASSYDQALHPTSRKKRANLRRREHKACSRVPAKRSEEQTSELQSLMRISYAVL